MACSYVGSAVPSVCHITRKEKQRRPASLWNQAVNVLYLLVGVAFAFDEEGGAAAASWPPAGRFRGISACLWVVPRCMPAWVAAGSMAATRNLMAAAASANCAVLVRHACDVPVRASLHVGYWAGGWADREDLFAHAIALRARADIEVCAADEDAASRQGSSTDGQARSWLARR